MPIKYDKLLHLLKDKGYTTYRIRKERLIGQGTLTALKMVQEDLTARP